MGDKDSKACITIILPEFEKPLRYNRKIDHLGDQKGEFYEYFTGFNNYESSKTNKFTTLKRILNKYNRDPFYNYDGNERFMIYKQRELLKNEPTYLPLFIKSIHWSFIEMMHEAHKILKTWAPIDANTALGLLQNECSDKHVRRFAVTKIMKLSNRALSDFMPQLVQALKFESHHTSYLADMLLKRALESPRVVGHAYFWALNASLYDQFSFERLYLHYERFLFLCSDYRKELYFQTKINDIIVETSSLSLRSPGMDKKELAMILKDYVNSQIIQVQEELEFKYFIMPHIPDTPFCTIVNLRILSSKQEVVVFKCKIFSEEDENMLPRERLLEDDKDDKDDSNKVNVLFKIGDDLRKDQVVLQVFKLFDELCLEKNLNLFMMPYIVLATGFKLGYIEFVQPSMDLVDIHD